MRNLIRLRIIGTTNTKYIIKEKEIIKNELIHGRHSQLRLAALKRINYAVGSREVNKNCFGSAIWKFGTGKPKYEQYNKKKQQEKLNKWHFQATGK